MIKSIKKILVDTNVILDLFYDTEQWGAWSSEILEHYAKYSTLCINAIIYTEVSIGFENIEDCEKSLVDFSFLPIPKEALFLAGKTFLQYRKSHGIKHSTLPDFFIGSHAVVDNMALISRDKGRYKSYFPGIQLICP